MARSSVIQKLETHLECGVCLERYNEPRNLSCQHSYCTGCLKGLMTRNHRIKCPECREETEVPAGDASLLKPNFLLNKLLSIKDDNQPDVGPMCKKHQEEVIKLYCKTCNRLICRDCSVLEHRDHGYVLIKDVYDDEIEKIMEHVTKAGMSIPVFKSAIESIEHQERNVQENLMVVRDGINVYVEKRIAAMERKRQSLMQDLERLSLPPIARLREEKEALVRGLDQLEAGVGWAEQALVEKNQARVLLMKGEIIAQMQELSSLDRPPVPRETLSYKVEANSTLNDESDANGAKITESGKYTLSMVGGEVGVIYSTVAKQDCNFIINPAQDNLDEEIGKADVVEVEITPVDGKMVSGKPKRESDGTYKFKYRPSVMGLYRITVLINGSLSCGSPVTWKVNSAMYLPSHLGACGKVMKNVVKGKHWRERNSVLPQDCCFSKGQHSWKIQIHTMKYAVGDKHRVGVTHSNGLRKTFWKEGERCCESLDGNYFEKVKSSLHFHYINDVFTLFLNVDKNQLIIFNEETGESDTFHNIKAPVSPYIHPTSTLLFKVRDV